MSNRAEISNFKDVVVSVTPTLDTNAYASGDTLFDTTKVQVLTAAPTGSAARGLRGRIASVTVLDKSDQNAGMTLFFLRSNVGFGTANSAPNISDDNAEQIVGRVTIAAADYTDLGGCDFAQAHNLNIPFVLPSNQRELYVAAITNGTPTYAAAGLVLRVAVEVQEA